jgi:cell filamentation protein
MSRYSDRDPYLDPETGVLRNRLGLTDEAAIEQAEAACVAVRSYELSLTPLEGGFDLVHLQAIHRYLFRDVYEWAGELRSIDIGKGGNHFAHYAHIENAAAPLFLQLAGENHLTGLAAADFSRRAAFYLGGLNALHPFREGNGRAQREFISHLAHANGLLHRVGECGAGGHARRSDPILPWQHIEAGGSHSGEPQRPGAGR